MKYYLMPYNRNVVFFIVMLLASPALSVSGVLGMGFFPNEKIALLLVALSKHAWRNKFQQFRLLGSCAACVFIILTAIHSALGVDYLPRAGINTALVIASLPLYVSYFSYNYRQTLEIIFFVGLIQFGLSLFQQVMMQLGYSDIINLFNNYPAQESYRYAVGESGLFFRTSGLFNESSSYALYQWMAVISGISLGVHKRLLGIVVLSVLSLEAIINGSMTGYLFVLTYLVFSKNYKAILYLIGAAVLLSLLTNQFFETTYDIYNLWTNKFIKQFESLQEGSVGVTRLSGTINNIKNMLDNDYFLIGSGLTWDNASLNIVAIYLRGFGIIGLTVVLVYILFIVVHAPLQYAVATIVVLNINGHLSSSVNILLLSLCFLNYIEPSRFFSRSNYWNFFRFRRTQRKSLTCCSYHHNVKV